MPRPKNILIFTLLSVFSLQLSAFAFTFGGDFRARGEYANGANTLDTDAPLSEQASLRLRARAWASITAPKIPLSLNTRIAAYPRYFIREASVGTFRKKTGVEWRYAIIDQLNIRYENAFKLPLTLTLGRQDFTGANEWLVGDGTPADGTFTHFFDAIRAQYELKKTNTRIDLMLLRQAADVDDVLPVIGRTENVNGGTYSLTEQAERGVIITLTNTSLKNTRIETGFLYKHDKAQRSNGDSGEIYTLTAKLSGQAAAHLEYAAEIAYQFGRKTDAYINGTARRDISAYALNSRLDYRFNDTRKNSLGIVCEYLSGDDGTGKDGMFDILWGRRTSFSEIMSSSISPETNDRAEQYNNLARAGFEWSAHLAKNTQCAAAYNALFAPEKNPTRARVAQFSGDSHFRGHYFRAAVTHKITEQLQARLLGELIFQGDFYTQNDTLSFIRAQMFFTW